MICLNSQGLPLIEELKDLRAITLEDMEKEKDIIEKTGDEKEALIEEIVEYNINNGTSVIFLEPKDMYDQAIHGYSRQGNVIYSYNEIIQSLIDNNTTYEEAIEWVDFNTFGTFDHMSNVDWIKDNPNTNPPIFMYEE
jgi:hypothetical protein